MLNVELKGDDGLLDPALPQVRVGVASSAGSKRAFASSVSHRAAAVGEPACFGSLKAFQLGRISVQFRAICCCSSSVFRFN